MPVPVKFETIPEEGEVKRVSRKEFRFVDFSDAVHPFKAKRRLRRAAKNGWKKITKKRLKELDEILAKVLERDDSEGWSAKDLFLQPDHKETTCFNILLWIRIFYKTMFRAGRLSAVRSSSEMFVRSTPNYRESVFLFYLSGFIGSSVLRLSPLGVSRWKYGLSLFPFNFYVKVIYMEIIWWLVWM